MSSEQDAEQTPEEPSGSSDFSSQLLADMRAATPVAPRAGRPGRAGRPSQRRRSKWRDPADYSGPGPDDRDPQPVASAVEELVGDRGWAQALAVGGVEGRWAQIVGTDVAAHCLPEEFEAGRLTVRADSTAWATQVRMLAPTLLARLNDDLGAGTVTHLQVLAPQGPSWRKGKLRVKGRGPRDTYG